MARHFRQNRRLLVSLSSGYKFYVGVLLLSGAAACATAPSSTDQLASTTARELHIAKARLAAAEESLRRNRDLLEAREREASIAREQAQMAELARLDAERRAAQAEAEKGARAAVEDMARELARLQAQVKDLRAHQTERGWILTLRSDLLFDSDSATLKPGARGALDNLAAFMRRYPDRDIAIEGFTDVAGSDAANRRLSGSRAESVKRALVARGIEPSRLDARGYGAAFPVAGNETPDGRQLNRRVEIVINPS